MRSLLHNVSADLRFVINFHSTGPAFIWPFNGRKDNDIEKRAPKVLPILLQISEQAVFPSGTLKGNSAETMNTIIGGDADDYITATYGIPSITSELGEDLSFVE